MRYGDIETTSVVVVVVVVVTVVHQFSSTCVYRELTAYPFDMVVTTYPGCVFFSRVMPVPMAPTVFLDLQVPPDRVRW